MLVICSYNWSRKLSNTINLQKIKDKSQNHRHATDQRLINDRFILKLATTLWWASKVFRERASYKRPLSTSRIAMVPSTGAVHRNYLPSFFSSISKKRMTSSLSRLQHWWYSSTDSFAMYYLRHRLLYCRAISNSGFTTTTLVLQLPPWRSKHRIKGSCGFAFKGFTHGRRYVSFIPYHVAILHESYNTNTRIHWRKSTR